MPKKACSKEKHHNWEGGISENMYAYSIMKKYNLTMDDYNRMLEKQDYRCAICKKHISELKRRLSVDHNHKTGEVRGLLCFKCNTVLGHMNDDIELLKNTIKYLKNSN